MERREGDRVARQFDGKHILDTRGIEMYSSGTPMCSREGRR